MTVRFSRDSWEWLMREVDSTRCTAQELDDEDSDADLISDAVEFAVGGYGRFDWARYRSACVEFRMNDFTKRFRHSAPIGLKYEAKIVFTADSWSWIERRRGDMPASAFVDCVIANCSVVNWTEFNEAVERVGDDEAFVDKEGTLDDMEEKLARMYGKDWHRAV